MKIEHIAIASNSEKDSDKFFLQLLGMKKMKKFSVSKDLMQQFFGINKDTEFIRYEQGNFGVEVIITAEDSNSKDIFTHSCLSVESKDILVNKAKSLDFPIIKVARKDSTDYYLFVKDYYGNLFEIKNQ